MTHLDQNNPPPPQESLDEVLAKAIEIVDSRIDHFNNIMRMNPAGYARHRSASKSKAEYEQVKQALTRARRERIQKLQVSVLHPNLDQPEEYWLHLEQMDDKGVTIELSGGYIIRITKESHDEPE